MNDTATEDRVSGVEPYSLKDAPALIERVFPAQKISVEAQKERKANLGQTLTPLGSYWKGRKPLILCRALVLGSLLPATGDDDRDLEIFEMLLGIHDNAFGWREPDIKPRYIAETVELKEPYLYFNMRSKSDGDPVPYEFPIEHGEWPDLTIRWRRDLDANDKAELMSKAMWYWPYDKKVRHSKRPEECDEEWLLQPIWPEVNRHLGTNARSITQLAEHLGIMRFGKRPRVGDTFAGGGSVPFEAARVGCDVYASDLNPIGCMLTWGALNIIGADTQKIHEIEKEQRRIADAVESKITQLGVEHDRQGNRVRAFLYCLEVECPKTGWRVPLSPNWIVSQDKRAIVRLSPNHEKMRFDFEVVQNASDREIKQAGYGTLRNGDLVYELGGHEYRTPLKTIRGDYRGKDGFTKNKLRHWSKTEFAPRPDDILQERLYCIHWMSGDDLNAGSSRPYSWFATPTKDDMDRAKKVQNIVSDNLQRWQRDGVIPDMKIESGYNTDQPIRERGWTYWHHLFSPRQMLMLALVREEILDSHYRPEMEINFAKALDRNAKLCQWSATPAQDLPLRVFVNQALNTLANRGERADGLFLNSFLMRDVRNSPIKTACVINCTSAPSVQDFSDIWVTDPPYADAINYHEITEYFIAWIRKKPPEAFENWVWDSRRNKAIKGDGPEFRKGMIDAYKAMADQMPDNGLQCVMFTHQDTGVWRDMASIFWGAGLQVVSAWYIATETSSELKKGGYVQGTVIMVLRKRPEEGLDAYTDELVPEIKEEVRNQIATMTGMNQRAGEGERSENVFSDADMQMAGYAAALRVLTKYTEIDSRDMREYALETRQKGEQTEVDKLLDFAVRAANDELVPDGLTANAWSAAEPAERFYLRMLDVEGAGGHKLDNFQNFAKVFRVDNYRDLMASVKPNESRMKGAADFRAKELDNSDLAATRLGLALYAIREILRDADPETALKNLREASEDWHRDRNQIRALVAYMDAKLDGREGRDKEAEACRVLKGRIDNEGF